MGHVRSWSWITVITTSAAEIRDINTLQGRRIGEQEECMFLPLHSLRNFPFWFQSFHPVSPATPCGTSLDAPVFALYISFYLLRFIAYRVVSRNKNEIILC